MNDKKIGPLGARDYTIEELPYALMKSLPSMPFELASGYVEMALERLPEDVTHPAKYLNKILCYDLSRGAIIVPPNYTPTGDPGPAPPPAILNEMKQPAAPEDQRKATIDAFRRELFNRIPAMKDDLENARRKREAKERIYLARRNRGYTSTLPSGLIDRWTDDDQTKEG